MQCARMCAQFVETIRTTLSLDNKARGVAEKAFEDAKQGQPAATVEGLIAIVTNTQLEQPLREQGAVLLRRTLFAPRQSDSVWVRLGEPAQLVLRAQLLSCMESEQVRQVRRKLADCVQSLANGLVEAPAGDARPPVELAPWPELLPTLLRLISDPSRDAGVRADCVWVVKEMAMISWTALLAGGQQTHQIFKLCFADPSEALAANAAALLCSFVDAIDKKSERAPFATLIPEFVAVLQRLAQGTVPDNLDMVLQAMQEAAEFFKDHVSAHILPVMCAIAKGHGDNGSRRYAMEVIISLVEAKPKAMLSSPGFLEQALDVIIHFMMELDDDTETWAKEDYEQDEPEEQHQCGKDAIDRLARAANSTETPGFAPVLAMLKPALEKLFASGDWKQILTAVVVLAQIAEYIDEDDTVQQMMHGVRLQLRAAHPRVRYVSWSALAQFAVDHDDAITSDEWVKHLLPEFISAMDDACDRVSLRSMEAFQHYGECVEREDLEPFVQALMERLGKKMQTSTIFQKKSITFIAVIARQLEDGFAPYYPAIMPVLKQMIQATIHKVEERSLLGKCFECISLCAKAVGREGFRSDAELIMQWMIMATQVVNLPSNDPVKEYMMAASERICGTMKEDFLPFVPHILPGVLEKLTFKPKDVSELNDDADHGEMNIALTEEGGQLKVVVMQTSELEDLKNALECVHTFVDQLEKAFAPYITQTAQALLPVFEFSMAEEIRELAFETWGQLCLSAQKAAQGQVLNDLVMEFMRRVLPKMSSATESSTGVLKSRADGVKLCLEKAGPGVLGSGEIRHISEATLSLLREFLKKTEELRKERERRGDDDEELADEDDDVNLRTALCEIAGALMQHHPDHFVAEALPTWMPLLMQLLTPGLPADDRKLALYLMCDMLEHLGHRVTPHWSQFLPQLLADLHNTDVELRQAACYGVSLAAKDAAFAEVASQAAAKLAEVVTMSRGRAKKKSEKPVQACADNALSAIIEILMKHKTAIASAEEQLWGVWLNGLPCQVDEQEGQKNHGLLLKLLQQQNPRVLGIDGQNVPRLLGILVDLYRTDMVDDATSAGTARLLSSLGEATLRQHAVLHDL